MINSSELPTESSHEEEVHADKNESVLQLKHLITTIRQHYEKSLQQAQIQLQAEQEERLSIQNELENAQLQLANHQSHHEEEILSLRNQQNTLKELLKAAQQENKRLVSSCPDKEKQESDTKPLQERIAFLCEQLKEKELLQDKYEQLTEECKQLSESLDEANDARNRGEEKIAQFYTTTSNLEMQVSELKQQNEKCNLEKEHYESEGNQYKTLLEETENHLRVAQQHLAKKVKESTILNERLEEQHTNLIEFAQTVETQKGHIAQLQASVELYQEHGKQIQEQLHNALKGTESKIVKWEEKYFHMYEKWQESENTIRELRKIEETYLQMQSIIANLENLIRSPSTSPLPTHQQRKIDSLIQDNTTPNEAKQKDPQQEFKEEKYNIFGMPHSPLYEKNPL